MSLVPDFAAKRALLTPNAVAFTEHSTGREWRFSQVDQAASKLAGWMQQSGLRAGDTAVILCQNRVEFFIALFACQKSGVILAPLNWRQPVAELAGVVATVSPRLIIFEDAYATEAATLGLPETACRLNLDQLQAVCADCPPARPREINDEDPWYLLFTSGTTGLPKAVVQTPRMALANATNASLATGISTDTTHLNFLPLFHTAGINLYTLPVFLAGGHTRILRKFELEAVLHLLESGACSHFFGVPAVYQALSQVENLSAHHLEKVQSFSSGGAALPDVQVRFFAERGAIILGGFGMTETGPMGFLTNPETARGKIGSIGRPQLMTEARIDGATGPGAATGELLLRGPSITPGYFNNPEATKAAFTRDGWLRSGDVVRRDAQGDYYIVDRIKDMYISGGENVYPAEVERVLHEHPAVLEAAVIGVPDEKWGEVGAAFILPRAACGAALDTGSLADWCAGRLAKYKIPVRFTCVSEFPRTASGKVRKPDLRNSLK